MIIFALSIGTLLECARDADAINARQQSNLELIRRFSAAHLVAGIREARSNYNPVTNN
jgi:hypothetical protein